MTSAESIKQITTQNRVLLYFLPASACAISFLYFVTFLFSLGYYYGGIINLIFSGIYLITFLFYQINQINFGKHFLSVAFLIQVTLLSTYLFPKESFFQLYFLIAIPLVFMLFESVNRKSRIFYSFIIMLLLMIIQLRTDETIRPFNFIADDIDLTRNYNIICSFLVLSISVMIFFRTSEKQALATQELALTDPLTGLNNRRSFYPLAEQQLINAKRDIRPLSLLYIDIDDFKKIIDQYGHQAGDQALKSLAQALRKRCRKSDLLARIGSDEFTLLMVNADELVAKQFAAEIIQSIPILFQAEQQRPITVSIGLALFDTNDASLDSLMERADKALYQAKSAGRNRFEMIR